MKMRSLQTISRDLGALSPADRQIVCRLAYQLQDVDWATKHELTESESSMRRLLRDIISKQASDVRMAGIDLG